MRRRRFETAALAAALVTTSWAAGARAQPAGGMPDLRAMSGKPLPVPNLAPGTVTVRVSRQIPVNTVAGVEVTAIVVSSAGEARKRTTKTGDDGRAIFEGLTPDSDFSASVTVDGERLETSKFRIPAEGGTRVMLIAGLGAGGPQKDGEQQGFTLGAVTGAVAPQDGLAPGTLEISLVDHAGGPLPGKPVQLGQVATDNSIKVHKATSDAAGVARFAGLPIGESAVYAAVVEHQGMRLGTNGFRMDAGKGMRGRIHALERTTDTNVVRIDDRSKIIFEVSEDAVAVMEQLVFKNESEKLFDPGERGFVVPLPEGFVGARELEGGARIDIRENQGIAVRAALPPKRAEVFPTQARVGFVVPADGRGTVNLVQPVPYGMESPLVLVPASARLTVEAPGLTQQPDRNDNAGNPVKIYELRTIPPGGVLTLTVRGLPMQDKGGRNFVAVLCVGLVVFAVVAGRRPKAVAAAAGASAEALSTRREKLFAELVGLEQARRRAPDPKLDERRGEVVSKLEAVYRDLARAEHGESPAP